MAMGVFLQVIMISPSLLFHMSLHPCFLCASDYVYKAHNFSVALFCFTLGRSSLLLLPLLSLKGFICPEPRC